MVTYRAERFSAGTMATTYTPKTEKQIAELIARFYMDPFGFVMAAYPWGEAVLSDGSPNPLKNKSGPEPWQRDLLLAVGAHIRENTELTALDLEMSIWRSAVASGHGVGKSAIVAWLIQFFMSTRPDTRIVVTANTQSQLADKTWPELAKWHKLLVNKHWFTWTATQYYFAQYPEEQRKNYMATAATVSEHNTEAFAGLHNEGKTVVVLFDEASGIAAKIWEVAQGALTDGEGFFFAFGNPTRPDGEFADCFDKHADMYYLRNIDARSVSHTNKQQLMDIIKLYGVESDQAKIRIYGQFPRQSYNGFISVQSVEDSIARELYPDSDAALIMAIDVARFGGDEIVFGFRQGRDARSIKMLTFKGLATTRTVEIALELIGRYRPDATVVESTGPGAGVIDMLRARNVKVIEVHPGARAIAHEIYFNRRAEYWSLMQKALAENLCIYADPVLEKQLVGIQYSLDRHEQRTRLEAKEEYQERTGLSSPDRADTLALTFAATVQRRDAANIRALNMPGDQNLAVTEYDPYTY